ncbi:efflux RND transporter periplasmic adaptor subunit [Erythrobacter sp. NFXS35]|uniref:efflux RND transporter periplasmic adaptor subunit n=1 Tax=Erythrobacter sp. NFXS35 TaxID=2818436 RepID=UPI0032E04159
MVARTREAALAFRVGGVINRLTVDAGDRVAAGQMIAALDAQDVASRLATASADLARAKQDLERVAGLADAGAISQQQADNLATRVASAQAAYDAARFDSRSARLAAPFAGVVLARQAQRGEFVQPGQAIVTLADSTSPLVLKLPVADRDAARIRLGNTARIAAPNGEVTGRVTRIGQLSASQSGTIEVEVTLPPKSGLTSGMTAKATLETAPRRGEQASARIPAEAILEAKGKRAFVMRYDPAKGIAVRTAIGFAGFDGDDALVTGLPPQAQVITGGAGYIADGQTVSVTRQPAR